MDLLKVTNDSVLMDDCIVIPSNICKQMLHALHSAHQGINNMCYRANQIVYGPRMNNDICKIRYTSCTCNNIVPI